MTWSNIKFTANEVIRICIQVVLGAVFIIMMKADIKMIADGQAEMKQETKEDRERDRAWKAKMEAEYSEMKVRLAILEQKVTNLEIYKQ
ncbi:hypothetical protein [Chitinophaga sp. YIM B06452]|uniref:hypothetical protein n=1 Tax=Chitinophaga sp. YIM B06452 TaxID=3082158 RepID=UPI0031FE5FB2